MKITLDELKNKLIAAASKFVTSEEAKYFAIEQIDTHLKKSPRSNPLSDAIGDLENWSKNQGKKFEIQVDKPSALLINCNDLSPSLKIKYFHDELEKRAKINGISMLGINNSGGIHTLNLWTDGLGKRDLICICFFNGGPDSVVPFNGTKGIFGTNPLSYAIPTLDKPIIVDMATSNIPFFEYKNANNNNLPLKPNSAVDVNGSPTTDPKLAATKDGCVNLLPLGSSYKGYALVLLVEILTGSLVRSFLSTEMSSEYILNEHGGLMIVIDIASFTDINKFKKSVSDMCQEIRNQKPADGTRITVPGDRNYEKLSVIEKNGLIEIDDTLVEKLNNLQ